MKNQILSTAPYKGTSDMYPEDTLVRNYLFNIWSTVAKSFGYEEYDTPLIEEAQLYRVKSGEELANSQLYNFVDKGGREIALRPEMTPSLARMIAAKKMELTLPIRWFNIGRFYRYEKPQKGRRREFFQLNIDLFGIPTLEAEIEIIQYVMTVMEKLKAPKETYELKINNRYLLDYLFTEILGLDEERKAKVARAIDNYLKLSPSDFSEYLVEVGLTQEQVVKVNEFISWDIEDLKKISEVSRGAKELIELFEKAQTLGITNLKFAPYVMRGLLYYTGTVVEMYDIGSKENPRALFGGGRYDDLLSIFDKETLPAFGLGWGDVTTLDYLSTYNLLPTTSTDTKVFVTLMGEQMYKESNMLGTYLREQGINTQIQLVPTKLSNQLKYANKKGIPWVIIVGEDEKEKGVIQLKDMINGENYTVKKEEILQKIF
jgi:histidyl-tRNA synthetase